MTQFEGIGSIKFPNKVSAPRFHSSVIPSQTWCRKNIKKLGICPRANFLVVGLEVWNWRWGRGGEGGVTPLQALKSIFSFFLFFCVCLFCVSIQTVAHFPSLLLRTYIGWHSSNMGLFVDNVKKETQKNKNRRRHLHNERTVRIG